MAPLLAAFLLVGRAAHAAPPVADPMVQPAIDGVLAAFAAHPVVALGDVHVLAQEGAFYAALVADPRFARTVGNVVVEFGGSAHQDAVDRYLDGRPVPSAELRKAWTDVVGWVPAVIWREYRDFFAAVRAANAGLPPDRRIRVWLGEPPIDWSKVHSRTELKALNLDRDQYPADLIKRRILARGKKALVIYGFQHLRFGNGLEARVEADYPGSFFVAQPYFGFNEPDCDRAFEAHAAAWPAPALAWPVKDTEMAALLRRPGCTFLPELMAGAPAPSPEVMAQLLKADENSSGVTSDALLYLGPAASLTASPVDPAVYLDETQFREISRHRQIMIGQPLDRAAYAAAAARGVESLDHHLGRKPGGANGP